ncbi:hypothetical protein Bbelb_145620 [Branchiostoma belcheri]|nr:hypothetical protein Bbelb_145620 [Branchiostoma belcheri]
MSLNMQVVCVVAIIVGLMFSVKLITMGMVTTYSCSRPADENNGLVEDDGYRALYQDPPAEIIMMLGKILENASVLFIVLGAFGVVWAFVVMMLQFDLPAVFTCATFARAPLCCLQRNLGTAFRKKKMTGLDKFVENVSVFFIVLGSVGVVVGSQPGEDITSTSLDAITSPSSR